MFDCAFYRLSRQLVCERSGSLVYSMLTVKDIPHGWNSTKRYDTSLPLNRSETFFLFFEQEFKNEHHPSQDIFGLNFSLTDSAETLEGGFTL